MKTSTSPLLRRAGHTLPLAALAVRRCLAWPLLALVLLLPASAGWAATTRTVNSLNDNGAGSLREAIGSSIDGDTINFSVAGTITLTNGELVIGRSIAINGPTMASLTVSGNHNRRVFNIVAGTTDISSLTIANGRGSGVTDNLGGGIYVGVSAGLHLTKCTISGNNNPNGYGGGLGNRGTLTLDSCTVFGNSILLGSGGGIYQEGGILTIYNCTISGNTTINRGGGIANFGASAPISILNTIIANNTGAPSGPDIDSKVPVISQGHNLIGDRGSSVGWVGSDLLGNSVSPLNPQLGPLKDNSGPTFTMALLPNSAAIDAGDDAVLGSPYNLSTDQRGRARRTSDHVDIGAYEFSTITRLVTATSDSGGGSLRNAIAMAGPLDRILFAPVVRGKIRLTNGELLINKPLSIVGPGAPVLAISGNTDSRVFHIGPQGDVDIYALTITEGRVVQTNGIDGAFNSRGTPGGFALGGGVFNEGNLKIFDSMIVSNSVQGGRGGRGYEDFGLSSWNGENGGPAVGAGIYSAGLLELHRCTLTGNGAVGGVGGIGAGVAVGFSTASGTGGYASGAGAFAISASLENCTVAGNLSTGGQGGRGPQLVVAPFYDAGGPGGPAAGGGLSGGLALTTCSVSGNSVTGGMGGTGSVAGATGAAMAGGVNVLQLSSVQSTIIAGNTGSATSPDVNGAVTSAGWNLIGITDGSSGWTTNDFLGNSTFPLSALLGPCQDNGGPVWTMCPLSGSPARDKGRSGLASDARGGRRIVDFPNIPNAPGGDGSDIGALEVDSLFGAITISLVTTGTTSGFALVRFKSDPGTTYWLQQTSVVTNRAWTNIVGTGMTGNGQNLQAFDFGPLPTARFYRVRAD